MTRVAPLPLLRRVFALEKDAAATMRRKGYTRARPPHTRRAWPLRRRRRDAAIFRPPLSMTRRLSRRGDLLASRSKDAAANGVHTRCCRTTLGAAFDRAPRPRRVFWRRLSYRERGYCHARVVCAARSRPLSLLSSQVHALDVAAARAAAHAPAPRRGRWVKGASS